MPRRVWQLGLRLSFILLILVLIQARTSSAAGDITYVYDELGRLVAVIDPAGDTAIYNYDAVGNLLSIARQSSALVSVIRFTPGSGPVGATVTIYGTAFSTTPSQNTVTFNGTAATVTAATANQLVVTVPAGATTGTIAVTAPAGSATSSATFTVTTAGGGAPSITGFTPSVGTPGTSVTVSGANFETIPTNNAARLNLTSAAVSAAMAGSLNLSVPNAGSGRISISTPAGTATSTGDFFIPPSPYTAADVVYTGRVAFAESRTVSIATGNKIGLLVFDGTAGARVSLNLTNPTLGHYQVTIYNPDWAVLNTVSRYSTNGAYFFEPKTLPLTGTYTIFVGSLDNTTGGLTLTPYDVPADYAGTITPGGASVAASLSPGQNGRLTFTGTGGRKVSLAISGSTIAGCSYSIKKPDGSALVTMTGVGAGAAFMDGTVLPVTGEYTIVVDPAYAYSGSTTLTLYDATDATGTITAGGAAVTATNTIPGQNVLLSFSGTAGQRVSLNMTDRTFTQGAVEVKKPDGGHLYSALIAAPNSGAFMDATTLPVTGTYTILVNPHYQYTGSLTLQLYDLPADLTSTLTFGAPVTLNVTLPGLNAALTFGGTAGQRVGLNMTGVTIAGSNITIKKPDGTTFASTSVGTGGGLFETNPLPVTGTYTVEVNPSGNYTGNMTLTLTDISDLTGTLTFGTPLMLTTTTAGQNIRATFSGAAGQRVSLQLAINQNCYVTVYKPDGTALVAQQTVWGSSGGTFIDTTTLPVAGTYAIVVDPWGTVTAGATLTLYDVPADVTGTLTVGGPAQTVTLSTPGQNGQLTFSGTAGQQVTVRVTGNTINPVTVRLLKPDGAQLTYASTGLASFNLTTQTLATSGTYTIQIDPNTNRTGSLSISVTSP